MSSRLREHPRSTFEPVNALRALTGILAVVAIGSVSNALPARAESAALPAWLQPQRGSHARVDAAPWNDADEPEAALVASRASLARDFSADGTRPGDVVYAPIGVRVRIMRVYERGIVLVRSEHPAFQAYAPLDRLVPEVPRGTRLRAAGGFGGFAEFYRSVDAPPASAEELATGTALTALETGVAPFDTTLADFVRIRVRIDDGARRGRTGWVAVAYTGLAVRNAQMSAIEERACRCRIVRFETTAH